MILYDIDTNEIINITHFICEEDLHVSKSMINMMASITIKADIIHTSYIKEWYLLSINNGQIRSASEYKRSLYYKKSDKIIKLLNCFVKSIYYDEAGFISFGIYCDHYIVGDDSTFPDFKEIYRNTIIESLGI